MTTMTEATPAAMAAEASRILTEVREAEWPPSREAQWAIGWAYGEAADAMRDYCAVVSGEANLALLGIPDLGWAGDYEDEQAAAEQWTADQALECAKAARKRLEEYRGREEAAKGEAAA